jgi:hypothetical protein
MGKSELIRRQKIFEMKTQSFPSSPEETDPRLLEALASLNQISGAINQIGPSDAGSNDISLQLIVESAIHVVPGSSAVIYTYDQEAGLFERESRVSAGEGQPLLRLFDDATPTRGGCERSSAGAEYSLTKNLILAFIPIMPRVASKQSRVFL